MVSSKIQLVFRFPQLSQKFVFNLFICNWRITVLQYSVGFCHISTWISHRYMCPPPLERLSPLPPHSTPLCCHRALGWAPCVSEVFNDCVVWIRIHQWPHITTWLTYFLHVFWSLYVTHTHTQHSLFSLIRGIRSSVL